MKRPEKTLESKIFDNPDAVKPQNQDERDAQLVTALLHGVFSVSGNKISHRFLSSKTKPSEREARMALARILLKRGLLPRRLREGLAALFAPDPAFARLMPSRTVAFKNASKARGNLKKNQILALLVGGRRENGDSYDEATAWVAESQGLEVRHVKKIYGRFVLMAREFGVELGELVLPYMMPDKRLRVRRSGARCPRRPSAFVASDRRTDDMASDS